MSRTLADFLAGVAVALALVAIALPDRTASPRVARNERAWLEFTVAAGNVPPLTQGATQR